ncbi:hypothetical protein SLEP1_g53913 [Rubroshorea leprosula]|uniref:POX domain-containing protein n=1 Tax=Rubroshorea leprosula TaxID=152421 RepID=A0AAV5MAR0_9ROSI|nr:hypothetical protein SLEP1_g53913 [Rubroshorea leprosula]
MLRQFIISNSISSQTRLESQHFDAYCSVLRRNINTTFSQSSSSSLGLLPAIHAPGETMSRSKDLLPVSAVAEEQLMMDLPEAANESGDHHTQRLSLSLEFCSNEMLLSEKQELHIKMTKLISLLEEVEERYERYRHKMEEVVSSFEAMAGVGAVKFYTALTLQAMSGHFWSLRDAIVAQINVTRRKFMHDLPKISTGMSQLSLFNRESRSNRLSLEQLGLMQQQTQAWRPIRGLQDTSVAILRSWLFEHFLHPSEMVGNSGFEQLS